MDNDPSLKNVSLEAQQLFKTFWTRELFNVKNITNNDFRNQELPLARIKKIMKLDEDVKMIAGEAPVLFAKAVEIFISELTLRAWINTEENKRRTLQRNDIAMAIAKYDQFDFLIDIVPREEIKPINNKKSDNITTSNNNQTIVGNDQLNYLVQITQQQSGSGQSIQIISPTTTGTNQGQASFSLSPQVIQLPVQSTTSQNPDGTQLINLDHSSNSQVSQLPITLSSQQFQQIIQNQSTSQNQQILLNQSPLPQYIATNTAGQVVQTLITSNTTKVVQRKQTSLTPVQLSSSSLTPRK